MVLKKRIVIAGFHVNDEILNTQKKYYWRVFPHTENKDIKFKKGHLADVVTFKGAQTVFITGVYLPQTEDAKKWAKGLRRVLKYHIEPTNQKYIDQYKQYLKSQKAKDN